MGGRIREVKFVGMDEKSFVNVLGFFPPSVNHACILGKYDATPLLMKRD